MELILYLERLLWGGPLLAALMGSHVYFTWRLRGVQRHTLRAIRLSLSGERGEGGVSSFGALSASLAAAIGTGNVVGVATAVALGGPGAVFWCWLTGVLGMATRYAESLLTLRHRRVLPDGTATGGPMYVMEEDLQSPGLAKWFCRMGVMTAVGTGALLQANAIAGALSGALGVPALLTGLGTAALAGLVISGGVRGIAGFCEWLVPAMAGLYLLGCGGLIWSNRGVLPETLELMLRSAFLPRAAGGGFVGSTVLTAARYGVARGLFTNESGMGTAPMAAAAAPCRSPEREALVSMTGVFWDTVVICAMTGLALVSSMVREPERFAGADPGTLCFLAFSRLPLGDWVLTVSLVSFAFATVIGWWWYGESCWRYLRGERGLRSYRAFYLLAAGVGGLGALEPVWALGGLLAGAMAAPNLYCLWRMRGELRGIRKNQMPDR